MGHGRPRSAYSQHVQNAAAHRPLCVLMERGHLLVMHTCTVPTMAAEAPLMAANSAVRDAAEDTPAAVTAAFSK